MAKWKSINIPKNIYDAMQEIVDDENSLYTNKSDLAKDALRSKIESIRSQDKNWKERHSGGDNE